MRTLAVHLFNEDNDEGAAFRIAHDKRGVKLPVKIVPAPFGSASSVHQRYDQIMNDPVSAISRIDLSGMNLSVAYMTVHSEGHNIILIGDFEADQILSVVGNAKASGYFVHVSSLESNLQLTI